MKKIASLTLTGATPLTKRESSTPTDVIAATPTTVTIQSAQPFALPAFLPMPPFPEPIETPSLDQKSMPPPLTPTKVNAAHGLLLLWNCDQLREVTRSVLDLPSARTSARSSPLYARWIILEQLYRHKHITKDDYERGKEHLKNEICVVE